MDEAPDPLLALLAALVAVAIPAPAGAATTGRALVLLDRPAPGATAAARVQARAVIARHGLRRAGPVVPEVGVLTVRPAAGETIAELAARLERDPRVVAVEREYRHQPRLVPSDPAMSQPDPGRRRAALPVVPAPPGISSGLGPQPGGGRAGRRDRLGDRLGSPRARRQGRDCPRPRRYDGRDRGRGRPRHPCRGPRMRRDRQWRRDRRRRFGLPPDPGEERPDQLERDRGASSTPPAAGRS